MKPETRASSGTMTPEAAEVVEPLLTTVHQRVSSLKVDAGKRRTGAGSKRFSRYQSWPRLGP
jgi:hypothetical protein